MRMSATRVLISLILAGVLTPLVFNSNAIAITLDPVVFGQTRNFGAGQAFSNTTMQIFRGTVFEDRNNMEFDITGISSPVVSAELVIPVFSTNSSLGASIDLRSYSGNGTIEFADFSAGSTDFQFSVSAIPETVTLDVTSILTALIGTNASHIGFTGAFTTLASVPFFAGLSFTDLSPAVMAIPELNIETGSTAVVPLPAAFPLFAGGLGLMGLLGWRRKKAESALT